MFRVIVCDDNENDLNKISIIINKFMQNNRIEYKINLYNDFNDEFMKEVNEIYPFKVYILDIETPSRSGIDVARDIRFRDYISPIIFLTGHNDLGIQLLSEDIPFTAFINKYVNYENRLKRCLNKSLKVLSCNRVINIRDNNTKYHIKKDDILYITKDSYERKTIIVTDYQEFRIKNSMNYLKSILDDQFVQTHRACIINRERAVEINYSTRTIRFDNNITIDLLSNKYKSEVLK